MWASFPLDLAVFFVNEEITVMRNVVISMKPKCQGVAGRSNQKAESVGSENFELAQNIRK